MGADFRGTAGDTGVVYADKFSTGNIQMPVVVASGEVTFDPPSLTTGAFAISSAIAVTGIALGDSIELFPPYDTQGIMYQASPSAAGNMKISLTSASSSTVDLASGSWGYAVKRRV